MRGLILFVVSGADAKMHTWNAQRVFGQLSYNIVTSKSAQKDRAHPHKTGVRFEGAPWECSEEQPFGPSLLVRPESKLGVPHNAAEVKMEQLLQDYHEHIRTASDGRGNDTALSTDMILLHRIARGVRKHGSKSNTSRTITVETGLANGGSAVAIMSALGSGSLHIAIDPFQSQQYDGLALDSVRLFLGRMEAQTSHPTPQVALLQHVSTIYPLRVSPLLDAHIYFLHPHISCMPVTPGCRVGTCLTHSPYTQSPASPHMHNTCGTSE